MNIVRKQTRMVRNKISFCYLQLRCISIDSCMCHLFLSQVITWTIFISYKYVGIYFCSRYIAIYILRQYNCLKSHVSLTSLTFIVFLTQMQYISDQIINMTIRNCKLAKYVSTAIYSSISICYLKLLLIFVTSFIAHVSK
jgi:hypothetical protein